MKAPDVSVIHIPRAPSCLLKEVRRRYARSAVIRACVLACLFSYHPLARAAWVYQNVDPEYPETTVLGWLDGSDVFTSLDALGTGSDPDGDGLSNEVEHMAGSDPFVHDFDDVAIPRGSWSVRWNSGYGEFDEVWKNQEGSLCWLNGDEEGNWDYDTLNNLEEYAVGTNPYDPDTDNDSIHDGDEIAITGTSPNTPFSARPEGWSPWISDFDFAYIQSHPGVSYVPPEYPNGELPSFSNATYYDFDGDGRNNPEDNYPADPMNNDLDQDGLDDSNGDPVPGNAQNPSPFNGSNWPTGALNDIDGDGLLNWYDPYPSESVTGDADGDLILDTVDPVPGNFENWSPENSISWRRNALLDIDGDSISNWSDTFPYDFWNGTGANDDDEDGFQNSLDPVPASAANFSPHNGLEWLGGPGITSEALADWDDDDIKNWFDSHPNDPYQNLPDFDADGWENGDDPYPADITNKSAVNGILWYANMKLDNDNDGQENWADPFPSDPFDNIPDFDGDTIPNATDPAPRDPNNYSEHNGVTWQAWWNGDADSDGVSNFFDTYPYPASQTDADSDGIKDDLDPFPTDSTNYSEINSIAWYSSVLGDSDGDTTLNYQDGYPYDPFDNNPDADSDGIPNPDDPCPRDYSNSSNINGIAWVGMSALDNADGDYLLNWWDPEPYTVNSHPDVDLDGILNGSDPFPEDANNYSSINSTSWYGDVLGDNDGDGNLNWSDSYPYDSRDGMDSIDTDGDGLSLWDEIQYQLDDYDRDVDDDGLTDGEECEIYGTDPKEKFSVSRSRGWDDDFYSDYFLVDLTDTDGDQIPDVVELFFAGMDPSESADAAGDLDGNGITNLQQYQTGMALNADLQRFDADLDGMSDIFEDYRGFNKDDPSDATDDADGDHLLNWEEYQLRLNPHDPNTLGRGGIYTTDKVRLLEEVTSTNDRMMFGGEGDVAPPNGEPDWLDTAMTMPNFSPQTGTDWDGDGLPNAWEHRYGVRNYPNGLNMRAQDAEGDLEPGGGDGLTNAQEYYLATNPMIADSDANGVNDADEDWDGDGLNGLQEYANGTNARSWDSDSDGVSDAQEIAEGSDPNSSTSNSNAAVGLRIFTPLPPTAK